tara:strand:- start:2800 stop:4077 length:1278 start_codon:yes stop_codon:yes gene_type:complete
MTIKNELKNASLSSDNELKKKDDDKKLSNQNDKVPKKRGRKPKQKNETDKPKTKGKRGRRPINKFKYDSNLQPNMSNIDNNENIILKLPIECLNTNIDIINDNISYHPNIPLPKPYDNGANLYKSYNDTDQNENDFQYLNGNVDDKKIRINNVNNNSNSFENVNICENIQNISNNTYINKMEAKSSNKSDLFKDVKSINNKNICEKCSCKLENNNSRLIDNIMNKNKSKNYIEVMVKICNNNNGNKWISNTDISCFWCCHSFDNTPWGIPYKLEDNIFNLYGIFCSCNCALSYLINNENGDTLWEKIALLQLLYFKIYNKYENILPAPNKISLKKFGGSITIEEFRNITNSNEKTYSLEFPPCNSIVPILEESHKNNNLVNSFIPIDNNKLVKATNELKLKRNKPVNLKKNTLDTCMNIIYNNNT